tara:strand:+ start:5027 stop:5473 length:447 start_codon:yes stop_codon:yes gene_type:complete
MPKASKRERQKMAVAILPELPDELWHKIVHAVGNHSVVCASAVRLVDKWHARVLARTQIWTAFSELMQRRARAREEANDRDDSNFTDNEMRNCHRLVRGAEERGDFLMGRIAMRQCQLDPHMAIDAMRRSFRATREICNEFGVSVVAP